MANDIAKQGGGLFMDSKEKLTIDDTEYRNKLEGIIEGMLFAYGDPLPSEKIMKVLNLGKSTLLFLINEMNAKYQRTSRGIMIREINGSYQLCTKPECYDYLKELFAEPRPKPSLSQAAYEILAIIACNKPITKARVEQIRGVNCDGPISKLLEYELIRGAGRMDSPGRPILYETTEKFLKVFGFSSHEEVRTFLETTKPLIMI